MTSLKVLTRFCAASGTRSCYSATWKNMRIDENTKVLCHGIMSEQGTAHCRESLLHGTKVVAGVSFDVGETGKKHLDVPVYGSVAEAVAKTGANASLVCQHPLQAAKAIMESIMAEVPLVVCSTENIPSDEMIAVRRQLFLQSKSRLFGPSSPGIIAPGKSNVGAMPTYVDVHQKGCVGIVSRSCHFAYEAARLTTNIGLGQSMCFSIGRDSFLGTTLIDCLETLIQCPDTKAILLIGEVGSSLEEKAARYLRDHNSGPNAKPVVSFIDGMDAPANFRASAESKIAALESAGVIISKRSDMMAALLLKEMKRKGIKV